MEGCSFANRCRSEFAKEMLLSQSADAVPLVCWEEPAHMIEEQMWTVNGINLRVAFAQAAGCALVESRVVCSDIGMLHVVRSIDEVAGIVAALIDEMTSLRYASFHFSGSPRSGEKAFSMSLHRSREDAVHNLLNDRLPKEKGKPIPERGGSAKRGDVLCVSSAFESRDDASLFDLFGDFFDGGRFDSALRDAKRTVRGRSLAVEGDIETVLRMHDDGDQWHAKIARFSYKAPEDDEFDTACKSGFKFALETLGRYGTLVSVGGDCRACLDMGNGVVARLWMDDHPTLYAELAASDIDVKRVTLAGADTLCDDDDEDGEPLYDRLLQEFVKRIQSFADDISTLMHEQQGLPWFVVSRNRYGNGIEHVSGALDGVGALRLALDRHLGRDECEGIWREMADGNALEDVEMGVPNPRMGYIARLSEMEMEDSADGRSRSCTFQIDHLWDGEVEYTETVTILF